MTLIIDTNTLISAFLFTYSKPRKTFEKAFNSAKICSSLKTYDEFRDALLRSKFDKYISVEEKILALEQFKELAIFIKISETITDYRDPKDNKFP